MALDEAQIVYMENHIEETREYWDRVSESEGFDLEGIPPVTNGMTCCDCRTELIEYPYMALVDCYARMGLHRYNFSHGTHYKFLRVKKFNYTSNCLQFYYITLVARDPATNSRKVYQVGVSEESFGDLHLKCFIARPKGTPDTTNQPFQPHDIVPKYVLPHWPSDLNDTRRFHEIEEPEWKHNDWIHLYLELAVGRNDPLISAELLSRLKIVKVSIETSEDVEEPNERLQAKSATFYITFKGLADARVGEMGEDLERKVIVRRQVDELTGDLTLFGGFGFLVGEKVKERRMIVRSRKDIPSLKDILRQANIPSLKDVITQRPRKRRRGPELDLSWFNNQCTYEYEKKHNLPYPK